jgi:hypothetical protein
MAEPTVGSRVDLQVRVLFEQRCVELFHMVEPLVHGEEFTLLCFDGVNMAWKTSSPAMHRLITAALAGFHRSGSFVTMPGRFAFSGALIVKAMPEHREVQWAIFLGRAACQGYLSNCNRADIADTLPTFLRVMQVDSGAAPRGALA